MRRRLAALAAPVLAVTVAAPMLTVAASGGADLVAGHKPVTVTSTTKADTPTYAKPAGRRWN